VDVVMNNKLVETAEKNSEIFYFMAQIIGNYLLEKHKIAVSEDSKIFCYIEISKLDSLKYKGSRVAIQRIRAKRNAKI